MLNNQERFTLMAMESNGDGFDVNDNVVYTDLINKGFDTNKETRLINIKKRMDHFRRVYNRMNLFMNKFGGMVENYMFYDTIPNYTYNTGEVGTITINANDLKELGYRPDDLTATDAERHIDSLYMKGMDDNYNTKEIKDSIDVHFNIKEPADGHWNEGITLLIK